MAEGAAEKQLLACWIDEVPDHPWRAFHGYEDVCATYRCYVARERHPVPPDPRDTTDGLGRRSPPPVGGHNVLEEH